MENIFLMKVFEPFTEIEDDFSSIFFGYAMKLFLCVPKISIKHGFKDHINIFRIIENSIQLDNIFMWEVEVNFDFPKKIFLVLFVFQILLVNFL